MPLFALVEGPAFPLESKDAIRRESKVSLGGLPIKELTIPCPKSFVCFLLPFSLHRRCFGIWNPSLECSSYCRQYLEMWSCLLAILDDKLYMDTL